MSETFRALLLEETGGGVASSIRELSVADLPPGDILIAVDYSSLNYKDGLALLGKGKVVRQYPMIPGIDLAGTVLESESPLWVPGDRVIATGFGLGERHCGGYTERERVQADWLVAVPAQMTIEHSMALGTAGLTAMLAVMALEDAGLAVGAGDVAVSGASGGVGSLAVALLAALGYRVVASTGKPQAHDDLRVLGAAEIVDRDALGPPSRPLASARWAGAVDTVGDGTLAGLLTSMKTGASIAVCGNAGGNELETTVLPFILRGVSLLGIDSNYCAIERRRTAWQRLAEQLPLHLLDRLAHRISLEQAPASAREILKGQVQGRIVVKVR